ncbi:MAG: hypothetical protein [Siphoviridae sp. ct7UA22]|nr:MAG: hypothetical protein [Siphoviridae sp. ct7UA22]
MPRTAQGEAKQSAQGRQERKRSDSCRTVRAALLCCRRSWRGLSVNKGLTQSRGSCIIYKFAQLLAERN